MPTHYVRTAFRSTHNVSKALVVNVLHLEAAVLTTPANYTTIASDVDTWLGAVYLAMLTSQHTLHDITVTEAEYPGAVPAQGIKNVELPGTRSTTATDLSAGLCSVIDLKTDTPKRYARGRLFAPPAMSSTETATGGQWNPVGPYMVGMNAFCTALLAGHTTGDADYAPIVFSRTRVDEVREPFFFPVVQAFPQQKQYMLRSRLTSP